MPSNNLWEIFKFDDLKKILRNSEKKFVVLAIITRDTSDPIRIMLKKFIKEKSKVYPRVTFLFYKAEKSDFGGLAPMFNENESDTLFPKLYHIYNVMHILSGVERVDNREVLEESITDIIHISYLRGEPKNDTEEQSDMDEHESVSEKKHNKKYQPETTISDSKSKPEEHIPIETKQQKKQMDLQRQQSQQSQQEKIYFDPVLEKQKYMEKLELLKKVQEEYMMGFIEECSKRKKDEERQKKKEQKKTK
jgi:hypothetical protein